MPDGTADLPSGIAVRRKIPGQPQPLRETTGQRCVYFDSEQRQQLWVGIQRHNPDLADLLRSEEIQLIRKLSGGFDLVLISEDLRHYMSDPE